VLAQSIGKKYIGENFRRLYETDKQKICRAPVFAI
jgi:hypothetical protein